MIEANTKADLNANRHTSIINAETFFQLGETDFSEWNFDDDALYASVFNQHAEADPAIEQDTKKVQFKSGWAA